MRTQLLKRVSHAHETTFHTETEHIKTNMHRITFIAMFVLFCSYVIKEIFTDNQSSNKTREKREADVTQISEKKFKKEHVSKAAFGRFGNQLLTKTWPKLVLHIRRKLYICVEYFLI